MTRFFGPEKKGRSLFVCAKVGPCGPTQKGGVTSGPPSLTLGFSLCVSCPCGWGFLVCAGGVCCARGCFGAWRFMISRGHFCAGSGEPLEKKKNRKFPFYARSGTGRCYIFTEPRMGEVHPCTFSVQKFTHAGSKVHPCTSPADPHG